ncbi:MAG TPA: MoxR family ATPase [Thermomicrobiales bacterium]|nr:MoxR family ATPase [Thermomicrobiales bacterium]
MAVELSISPAEFRSTAEQLEQQIERVIVGQRAVVTDVLTAIIAGGHVLLEGVPGLGKTRLVQTVARTLDLSFGRIQFTPDLMPADITGTNILQETEEGRRTFAFQRGPVFANILLADEINRATPKTQAALLEAMQEQTVTIANENHRLPEPFFVLATQNPLEMEGTYPLPEAQLDRFLFKLIVGYPSAEELHEIVGRTMQADTPVEKVADGATILRMGGVARQVPIANSVVDYAVRLVMATHPEHEHVPDATRKYIRYGASPRGAQALVLGGKVRALLAGRMNVSYEDIQGVLHPALRHRVILNFDAEASGIASDAVLDAIASQVPTTGF